MFDEAEFWELHNLSKERGVSREKLLEEKLAPLQGQLSKSQGELIGALTRYYATSSCGITPVHYSLNETLHAGIITPETKFPLTEVLFSFLFGIKNSHSLGLSSTYRRDFVKNKEGTFSDWAAFSYYPFLYFMARPPKVPADSWEHGCFGSHSTVFATEEPRLELYIGNRETIPFFQQQLEGWRYLQLSKLLGYEFPITEGVRVKIEQEQLEIFDKMCETEEIVRALVRERKARNKLVKATGGAIHHGTHIELTDEFVENMKYNPQIKNQRERVEGLLKTAIERGYHESGLKTERRSDAGVTIQIDLKEFFSQRKAMFEL